MNDYNPVSVARAGWPEASTEILALQRAFLPALTTPADGLMASTHHYLAHRGDEAVGYLGVAADGGICWLGTRQQDHDDIASALLRCAVRDTPRYDLGHLSIAANSPWLAVAQAIGFAPDPQDSTRHVLALPPNRGGTATGSELVRLEHIEDFRRFSVQLVQNASRRLTLYSEDLEAWLYDQEDFISAVLALARKSRYSDIRILVRDTRPLLEHGHRLLHAAQNASEKIQLRKLTSTTEKMPNYLVVDDDGLILRPDHQVIQGIGYTHYRARAKPLLEQFDLLWNCARTDPDLRRMKL